MLIVWTTIFAIESCRVRCPQLRCSWRRFEAHRDAGICLRRPSRYSSPWLLPPLAPWPGSRRASLWRRLATSSCLRRCALLLLVERRPTLPLRRRNPAPCCGRHGAICPMCAVNCRSRRVPIDLLADRYRGLDLYDFGFVADKSHFQNRSVCSFH